MLFRITVGAAAVALALAAAGIATAAPKEGGRNVEVIPVDCGELGSFDVVTNERASSAFGPDGVLVAKRFEFDNSFTVTTHDDATFGPINETFTEGVPGRGFEGRLVGCEFTLDIVESFALDAWGAEAWGIPAQYIGTEVTLDGTANGLAWVIVPGAH